MTIDKPGKGEEENACEGISMNNSTPTYPDSVAKTQGEDVVKKKSTQAGFPGIAVKICLCNFEEFTQSHNAFPQSLSHNKLQFPPQRR